ncbi:MAG TPA: hypothetical protein VGN81_05315 [Pseudonocardiaceae bacterium]
MDWHPHRWPRRTAVIPTYEHGLLVGGFGADSFACLFYIGTMVANSLCLTGLVGLVRGDPQLANGRNAVSATA